MGFATQVRQAAGSLLDLIEPRAGLLSLLWMALIFALSSQPTLPDTGFDPNIASIAGHFVAFGVLAGLIALFLRKRGVGGWRWAAGAVVIATLYGVTDEVHQSFVPGRDASLFDVLTDALGAICAVLLLKAITAART